MHHKHPLESTDDHSLLLARPESGTSRRKLVLATDWTTLVTGEKVWTRTQTLIHAAGWVDEVTPEDFPHQAHVQGDDGPTACKPLTATEILTTDDALLSGPSSTATDLP